jgi:hypothetical protein
MVQIEVKGFVPDIFQGSEFSLRVLDAKKNEKFYANCRAGQVGIKNLSLTVL